jgi:hypothetical protein
MVCVMSSVGDRMRLGALLSAAAFGVHQLRYMLAFGENAGHELAEEGHGYLEGAAPIAGMLLALTLASMLREVAAGRGGERPARRSTLWALCAGALLLIYVTQESLEGLLASGHPAGVEGIFGDGGWLAVPLSAGFGAALAVYAHVRSVVGASVRFLGVVRPPVGRQVLATLPSAAEVREHRAAVPSMLAGRGPPALLCH